VPVRWLVFSALAAVVGLVAVGGGARPAFACATCSCGDPTITSIGTEQAYAGRLRLSLGYAHRSDVSGTPLVDEETRREDRLDLSVAYAPSTWLALVASFPLLERQVSEVDLSRDTMRGTGDLDLRARVTLWRDRGFAPRHLAGVTLGVTLPTARVQDDAMGAPLDLDHQLGGLAVVPRAGVFYTHLRHPWAAFASASVAHLVLVDGEERAGDNLGFTAVAQYQPGETWGVRLGVDGKLEDRAHDGRASIDDTGGFALFVSPGVIVSPLMDLVVELSLQLPVVDALHGRHDESAVLQLATSYDF